MEWAGGHGEDAVLSTNQTDGAAGAGSDRESGGEPDPAVGLEEGKDTDPESWINFLGSMSAK